MQYQTPQAQQLCNIQPQDGVFVLEDALEQINNHLSNPTFTPQSRAYIELSQLQQTYTKYLNEARALREKGMASFRKYQALKNSDNTPPTSTKSMPTPTTKSIPSHRPPKPTHPPKRVQHNNANPNHAQQHTQTRAPKISLQQLMNEVCFPKMHHHRFHCS